MRRLASHALYFIEIAERLSREVLDPVQIKRFEVRAGLFSALLENELYERAFNEYKKLFEDLWWQLSKSYGYKKILKYDDDEKVVYLKNLMKMFLQYCKKKLLWGDFSI